MKPTTRHRALSGRSGHRGGEGVGMTGIARRVVRNEAAIGTAGTAR
ncbi:hypothetical protein ACFY19_07075 [Streptosporangium saharense]